MFNYIFSIPKKINNALSSWHDKEKVSTKKENPQTCTVKHLEKENTKFDYSDHPILYN